MRDYNLFTVTDQNIYHIHGISGQTAGDLGITIGMIFEVTDMIEGRFFDHICFTYAGIPCRCAIKVKNLTFTNPGSNL